MIRNIGLVVVLVNLIYLLFGFYLVRCLVLIYILFYKMIIYSLFFSSFILVFCDSIIWIYILDFGFIKYVYLGIKGRELFVFFFLKNDLEKVISKN